MPLPDLASMPGYDLSLAALVPGENVSWDSWSYRGVPYGDYTVCGAGDHISW